MYAGGEYSSPTMKKSFVLLCTLLAALPFISCKKSQESTPVTTGKFTVLGTKTDNQDQAQAKANAENTLQLHADLGAMVGLYGYNPAACLDAIPPEKRGKVSPAKIERTKGAKLKRGGPAGGGY